MLRIKIFFFFICISAQFIIAQEFNYKNIGTDQGLPSSEVYDILQDKKGYIWFATDKGIARYNGKEFTTYTTSDGLPDNTIFRICEDSKGRIWFTSQSNEIGYVSNNSVYKIPASEDLQKKIHSYDYIGVLYLDASDNIWINSRSIIFFSEAKTKYKNFKIIPPDKKAGHELIAVDKKRVLLNYNSTNSSFPDKKYGTVNLNFHASTDSGYYAKIKYALDGARYPFSFGTFGYAPKDEKYFLSFDSLLIAVSKNNQPEFKKLPHNIVNIITDKKNNLWVGFYKGGVAYFKDGDLTRDPIVFFNGLTVDDVCMDHEGGVWIATLEKGSFYIPSISIVVYSNISFLNDRITYIGELNNKVLVDTYGNTIAEKIGEQFTPVDYMCKTSKQKGGFYYVCKIRDTTYFSCSRELVRFTSDHEQLPLKNSKNFFKFGGGKFIFETDDHFIWLLYGGGLKKINNQTDSSTVYESAFRTTCAIPIGKDILVGGKKGLYLFHDGIYNRLSNPDTLLKSQISAMTKGTGGYIWIATIGNGLLQLKDNKIIQFSEKDKLISNSCTAVTLDQYGNTWVGTNKGVSCLCKSETGWTIKNISKLNGLNSNEITKLFSFRDTLWVGTMAGLNSFRIKDILQSLPSSPAYISSISVNNHLLSSDTTQFPYDENNFTFALSGLTFKDNGNHLYRYRLIGLDSNWQQTQSNELILNNIAPGNYTFEAQVANLDKIWSKDSASYSFTINKPFWLTWWFILLEVLFLIFITYLIILWRTNIIQRKEQEKLRINKLLTEYQMKALTAQMNPHFIFNAINSIQNFIIQNHSTLAYDYLIKFSKLIRLVLNNSKDNEVTIQQELDTLALYIELEQLRFEKSFDYHVSIDSKIETESLMIPGLLLQPYVENAIWHGLMPLKTKKGSISLAIVEENNLLKITITDNGVGRKASDQIKKKILHKSHQSVGMELTGKRIELFGQESKFSLEIIDNYDDNENSAGTTVQIILPMIEMY